MIIERIGTLQDFQLWLDCNYPDMTSDVLHNLIADQVQLISETDCPANKVHLSAVEEILDGVIIGNQEADIIFTTEELKTEIINWLSDYSA